MTTSGSGRPLLNSCCENISNHCIVPAAYSLQLEHGMHTLTIIQMCKIHRAKISTNTLVGCATDTDGQWTTGPINTVTTNGTTANVISNIDVL
jgi:hypothetical protein